MITGKQRSYLKSLAHHIEPVVFIGKEGLSENVIGELDKILDVRELVKVKIQDSALLDAKEVGNELTGVLGCEFVQAIGHKFTLYREASDPENRKIVLPKK